MLSIEDLKDIILLGHLDDKMLEKLLPYIDVLQFDENELIFREGDPADRFYFLKHGKILLEKQLKLLEIILTYYRRGADAIRRGVTLVKLKRMRILQDIVRAKSTIGNDALPQLDRLAARLERSIDQLESIYA